MTTTARAALLACLTVALAVSAQAGEAPLRLEPFQAVSRHGDWMAIAVPDNARAPAIVVFGAAKPGGEVRLTLSFRGPHCGPPLFGFQGKGRIGKDGAAVPLRLRVDGGKPRDFKARLRHTPVETTAIELEFRDLRDMSAFTASLLDAKQLAFSLKLPGKPLGARFNLEGLGQTAHDAIYVCRKATSQPPPGRERDT